MPSRFQGIHPSATADNQLLEVNFDQEFRGGLAIRSAKPCSYRVPASAVINISHGIRAAKGKGTSGGSASSNGRGQSLSSSGASTGGRNLSPKKPMAVVPPLDPGLEAASGGQPMPGMTPPDPKNLPNPMLLFAKKGEKPKSKAANNPPGPPRAQAAGPTGEPDVMQNLWKSLENSTKTQQQQQPEVKVLQRQPPPPVPSEEAVSRDLNSMLHIRPPAAAGGGESSVEAFFAAAAASSSSGVKPPPPMPPPPQKVDADSSFCRRLVAIRINRFN